MQTILGAGGAIGTELARELKKYTDRVRLVGRDPKAINPDDELVKADLLQPCQVEKAVEGAEVAYLTVGLTYTAKAWREQWPPLMRNVIEACKKQGVKLVFFDNVYTYDRDHLNPMTEDTPVRPTSKKGQVRFEVLKMLLDEMKSGRLEAIIARAADFMAPKNSVAVETIYKNLAAGKKAMILGKPDRLHNFTTSLDAARGTALLGNTPEAFGLVWHLPTDKNALPWKEWVELFAKEINTLPRYSVLPEFMLGMLGLFIPLMRELKDMNYQNVSDYVFTSEKFEKYFHYTPMAPAEGVKWVVEQLRKEQP